MSLSRRDLLGATAASAALLSLPRLAKAAVADDAVQKQIEKRHAEGVQRLQEWVRAALDRRREPRHGRGLRADDALAREAGFQTVTRVPTDGQPGVFATLDAGAPRTVGLYFMYDVKQVDPARVVLAAVGRPRSSTSRASARC